MQVQPMISAGLHVVAVLTDMMIVVVEEADTVGTEGGDTMTIIVLATMTDILDLLAMDVVKIMAHGASIAMRLIAMIAIIVETTTTVVAVGTTLLVIADVVMEKRLRENLIREVEIMTILQMIGTPVIRAAR